MTEDEAAPTPPHELQRFVKQVSDEMSSEYDRIVARAREDPGTAGDEGEENWAGLLSGWLPPSYHVTTKGRLLATSGELSPQLDVVVLQPGYPPALRDKKVYLASGVAAAFECKLTVRPQHIAKALQTSAVLRRMLPERTGSPRLELQSQLIYGLLAHSHDWRGPNATPVENVTRALWDGDLRHVKHPREMIDVICVADLATWTSGANVFVGPSLIPWSPELAGVYGDDGGTMAVYMGPGDHGDGPGNPIGVALAHVLQRLGWDDPSVRPIADYWRLAGMWGSASGAQRRWDPDAILTPDVAQRVRAGRLVNGASWDEWQMALL